MHTRISGTWNFVLITSCRVTECNRVHQTDSYKARDSLLCLVWKTDESRRQRSPTNRKLTEAFKFVLLVVLNTAQKV